jgi:hypothetical protein
MNQDFKPINCIRCGTVVWAGISWAGFARRLDTPVLSLEQEIVKRISNTMTFACYKTKVSFEAVERSVNRIKWGVSPGSVILAEHTCTSIRLFEVTPPNYWQARDYVERPF